MVILQNPTKFISGGGGGGGGNTPAIGQAISFVLRFFPFVLRIFGQYVEAIGQAISFVLRFFSLCVVNIASMWKP